MPAHIIGIMSGSSLDGLDIALCHFDVEHDLIKWEIVDAKTILYSDEWFELLKSAPSLSGFDLMRLDAVFGDFIGEQTKEFSFKELSGLYNRYLNFLRNARCRSSRFG